MTRRASRKPSKKRSSRPRKVPVGRSASAPRRAHRGLTDKAQPGAGVFDHGTLRLDVVFESHYVGELIIDEQRMRRAVARAVMSEPGGMIEQLRGAESARRLTEVLIDNVRLLLAAEAGSILFSRVLDQATVSVQHPVRNTSLSDEDRQREADLTPEMESAAQTYKEVRQDVTGLFEAIDKRGRGRPATRPDPALLRNLFSIYKSALTPLAQAFARYTTRCEAWLAFERSHPRAAQHFSKTGIKDRWLSKTKTSARELKSTGLADAALALALGSTLLSVRRQRVSRNNSSTK